MKHTINFNGIEVVLRWKGSLKKWTIIKVYTGDPGLAMNIIQLFLDDMGRRDLWYIQGWPATDKYQEMTLTESEKRNWKHWSRESVLSQTNEKPAV